MKKHFMNVLSIPRVSCIFLTALACFSTMLFGAVGEVQAGSLKITISPKEAVSEGASWRRTGTTAWHASGDTEAGVQQGTYAVEFLDLRFWTEPDAQAVTVGTGPTAALEVAFIECGDLKVTIGPEDAVAAGAQWRRVGTTTWQNSGYIEPNVPVGQNTVEFKMAPGFIKPANINKNVNKKRNYGALSATYAPVTYGALTVTISPAGAVAAGAKWRRIKTDGTATAWYASGYTEAHVPAFNYMIEFQGISGWVAPAWQSIAIETERTSSATGYYAQQTGTFQTLIYPAGAVSAGARWSLDAGRVWYSSGMTLTDLLPGLYSITYMTIPGWNTPPCQTATLAAGGAVSAANTYVQQPGTLQVVIDPPAAASAGAKWSMDAGATWQPSGTTLTGLTPGSFTITFSELAGWAKPIDKTVSFTAGGYGSASGTYIQQAGSLEVIIIPPEAVSGGAQWSIDGGATWNNSNATVSDIPMGTCTLTFKPINGWDTPVDQIVTLQQGIAKSALGAYVQQPGTMQVILSPDAVVGQAQWSIDNGTSWLYSGSTLTGLVAGTYTVIFSSVPGYGTPVDQVYPFEAGEAATIRGYYTTTWYRDADRDGYGNPAAAVQSAFQPQDYTIDSTDCDDANNTVYPGAPETCNAKDDNCNGETDEYSGPVWHRDADADSYGSPYEIMQACDQPAGYVEDRADCSDADGAVHPEAAETCNGIDDNCNGQTDEACTDIDCADADEDGYGTGQSCLGADCDDSDPAVHDQCTHCAVKIFPRHISKLLSIIKPIAGFIIWKADKTAFEKNTQIIWEDDSIKTLASVVVGKNKRLLYALCYIRPKNFILSSDYMVSVSTCSGQIAISRF